MYSDFYNLTGQPFQLTPDHRFFYGSSGHKRAMAHLSFGLSQGEGFIVITGDVGAGKTTLMGHLLSTLDSSRYVSATLVTTQLAADDVLRMVASAFGIDQEQADKATLLRRIGAFCQANYQEGKHCLLLIDEVQNLSFQALEELRMLSNFQLNGRALLQTFMLGQREFRATMRSEGFEQLRQRVIAAYHLKPLDAEETSGYIMHRLKTAGWNNDPEIDTDVFDAIHEFTGGVPRRINTLCDRLLLFGYLEELHKIDLKGFRSVQHDLLEEQGATSQELRQVVGGDVELPVEPRPMPATDKDRRKETGNSGVDADRLSAMEKSVESLAAAMRDELALLRHALTDKKGQDSND